ncbi:MAG: DUF4381 family protein [bacterium]|nr:DUF4381 family protein [bacterium]
MTDATSLDRLADVVLPPAVAWWPPAPGWLVAGAVVVGLVLRAAWTARRRRQANAAVSPRGAPSAVACARRARRPSCRRW